MPVHKDRMSRVHPFAETRNLNGDDILLRKFGFKILHRRKGEMAVWEHHGKEYTQTEALTYVRNKQADEKATESRKQEPGNPH